MFTQYKLTAYNDAKGSLFPIEFHELNLFEIKRIYSVYNNKGKRGGHAHYTEREFFFMAEGECICRVHDGKKWTSVSLQVGENAIYVPNLVWHEFNDFSKGASLVALSSTSYNPDREDYIENFDLFLNEVNNV
jgi:dTDP-4-dehydrorhamnose 3,5-epimerase-like enzyme